MRRFRAPAAALTRSGFFTGALSTERTPEQEALVTAHRDLWAEDGVEWDDAAEHFTVTLAPDGCESAIRNGHEMDRGAHG